MISSESSEVLADYTESVNKFLDMINKQCKVSSVHSMYSLSNNEAELVVKIRLYRPYPSVPKSDSMFGGEM